MDPFTAFLIFAAIVVFELWAAHAWVPLYYRFGLPVSRRRARIAGADPAALAARLNAAEGIPAGQPSLAAKVLPGSAVGAADLALRERMFENRPGLKYLPVMRFIARLHPAGRSAVLTGYLNLSAAYALVYSAYRAAVDRSFIPVAILVAFVLAMSYVAQRGVLAAAADRLENASIAQAAPRTGAETE